MRVLIITQDDPFYLAENLDLLFSDCPSEIEFVGCVLLSVSPFGKKNQSFLNKAFTTLKIFGIDFFIRYSFRFIINKFNKHKRVKNIIKKHNIPCIELDESINAKTSLLKLSSFSPDLLVSIAGNEIFKNPLIKLAPKGCLNLHTALLPKYRGLMPSFWVLKNNELKTGVSVFFVDEGIDSGEIICQESINIGNSSQENLIRRTKSIGMKLIIEAIIKIKSNKFTLIDNPDHDSSYFGFPTQSDVKVFKKIGKKFF